MAKLGGFVTFFYFLALAAGVVALFLPFWVSTEVEEASSVVNLMVVKKTQSGLWWVHETFEIKEHSLPDMDDSWKSIAGTPLDTDGVKAIKAMIVIGLACLLVVMLIAGCTRCCSNEDNKYRLQTVFCGAGVAAIVAGVLIGIGPIIYYTDVKGDYRFEGKDLSWCFWLSVASAGAAVLAGIMGILGCLVSFRKQKSHIMD